MKIAIVGNADISPDQRREIDGFDQVVRFNAPPPSHLHDGMRTDVLYLANTAKQTPGLLHDPAYVDGPVFQMAGRIVLPLAPEIVESHAPKPQLHLRLLGRRHDFTGLCRQIAARHGKPVEMLSAAAFHAAFAALGLAKSGRRSVMPSTGFLAVHHAFGSVPDGAAIHLFGFAFEGWKRHPWAGEKAWVMRNRSPGLVLHEVERESGR